MHHTVTGILVTAGLDRSDGSIIGFCPGAVLDLNVRAEGRQIDAVKLQIRMGILAELRIIVAGSGGPHIQEGNRIVVVGQPAVAGNGIIAVFTGVQEGSPFLVGQVHGDAHALEYIRQVFTDRLVAFAGVVQIFDGGEIGEGLGGFIKFIVLLQNLHRFRPVGFIGIFRHVPVTGILVRGTGFLIELIDTVRIGQAQRDERRRGLLTGLADFGHDVVPVIQQADRIADFSHGLLGIFTGQFTAFRQNAGIDVPADIVGAHLGTHHEFGRVFLFQGRDFVVGNIVDHLPVAVLVVGQHVVGVIGQIEVDLLHLDGIRQIVVFVLGQGDQGVMIPLGHGVGAVADIGRGIGCPGFAGHDILTDRKEGRESQQLVPVGNIVVQGYDQRLVIGGFHSQFVRIALDHFKHITVVSTQFFGSGAFPCEFKILGRYILAVGPLQAVHQRISIGRGTVIVDDGFRKLRRTGRNNHKSAFLILGPGGQPGKQMRDQGGAVHSGVQGRIQRIRLGSDADIDGSLGFFG